MSDNRSDSNNSTVLQRLLAEHYRSLGPSLSSPMGLPGSFNVALQDSSFENNIKCASCGQSSCNCQVKNETLESSLGNTTKMNCGNHSDQAARLDSLCRSTLVTAESMAYNSEFLQERIQTRRPPPTYKESRSEFSSLPVSSQQKFASDNRKHELMYSTPTQLNDNPGYSGSNANAVTPNNGRGHPKSNSGDDYLYTDYLRKSGRESQSHGSFGNLTGKSSPVVRSSSLHQEYLADKKVARKIHRMSMEEERLEMAKKQHAKQNRPKSHSEISSIFDWNRSSNNHDNQEKQCQGVVSTYKQPSFKEESLEISAANILDNIRTTPLSQLSPCVPDDTYITEVKHSESGLPQTPSGGKTIYIQGSQAGTRTYYQNKGNPWQADKQTSCLQTRPPPPPYPECQSEVKQHPIRPNSLPLGETNSKKTHDSPSIGNTPTVDSGQLTPIQGTGFYSSQRGVRYVKHGNQLTPTALSSPHHIRRTGSGKNGRGIVQSPCCTETNYVNGEFIPVASTPTIHNDIQQPNLTHRLESEFGKQPEQEYWSANRSKQFSGGKENNFSGEKRKFQSNLIEKLELENERLHNKLQNTTQKLMKFETIEVELQKLVEDHRALYQSADKREALETEMRSSLTRKLSALELENESLKNQLKANIADKKHSFDGKKELALESEEFHNYEAKNRKLLETERELLEELAERRERMSEQGEEIAFLSKSLQDSQDTINHLKDKLEQTSHYETYLDELSILRNVIAERQQVEQALLDSLSQDLTQKHLNEGGQDIKTVIDDAYISKDTQMLRIKAELVKWQHIYLKQDLLNSAENQRPRRSSEYHTHRHALSDSGIYGNNLHALTTSNEHVNCTDNAISERLKSDVGHCVNLTCDTSRKDFSCQTPENELTTATHPLYSGCEGLNPSVAVQTNHECDAPSEGYHSQQSSGSPTPNGDKSTLYFPESSNTKDVTTRYRANQSADV